MARVYLVGAGALLAAAGAAFAGPEATPVNYAWGSTPQGGGPFRFAANAELAGGIQGLGNSLGTTPALTGTQWLTFCLEFNEHISFGATYSAMLDSTGYLGGNGNATPSSSGYSQGVSYTGIGDGDPLDPRTAFLYSRFMAGQLDDSLHGSFAFAYGDNASGIALQNAIWFLENEIGSVSGLAAALVDDARASGWTDLGNVRVLNLFDYSYWDPTLINGSPRGYNRQSQLVLVPLPPETIMAGAGILGLALVYRRRK